jgi:hypothetical protein
MHPALEEEVQRMRERERVVASARAAAMWTLFKLVQRQHDPLAYEKECDHEEDLNGDFR